MRAHEAHALPEQREAHPDPALIPSDAHDATPEPPHAQLRHLCGDRGLGVHAEQYSYEIVALDSHVPAAAAAAAAEKSREEEQRRRRGEKKSRCQFKAGYNS